MDVALLRLCRSILFLPASNPRAIEKARTLDADMIILDCEDAVKPEDKAAARQAAVRAVADGFAGKPAAIRMNGFGTPWFGEDVVAFRASRADAVVLPKAEGAHQIQDVGRLLGKPMLAMIETASGVIHASAIAAHAIGLLAGTNDLALDLGIPPEAGRAGLSLGLQSVVLAARASGAAAFDGVYNKLDDPSGLEAQCREGRSFGFDGKSLIHPGQIDIANRLFGPSEQEIAEAERLIEAAGGGAERFEGRMIEDLHVEQARALLRKARRAA